MADSFRHKRYFQLIEYLGDSTADGTKKTFTGTAEEAYNELSLPAVWNTSSPTKTYSLADSNTSVVVTFEFDNESDQTAFKTAIDNAYDANTGFADGGPHVIHIKTEWLTTDGDIGFTSTNITDTAR